MAISSIRPAQDADRNQLAKMRQSLWPDTSFEDHLKDVEKVLDSGMSGSLPLVILVAQGDGQGALAGFLEVGLRSHADGCDTSHPVGFVEGWFVQEAFRGRGSGERW
jgi:aminoglycoside 6'-N-acetyltransferase I